MCCFVHLSSQIQHGHGPNSACRVLETFHFGWQTILFEGTIDDIAKGKTSNEIVSSRQKQTTLFVVQRPTILTLEFSQHVRTRCGCQNFVVWNFVVGIFNHYRFANTSRQFVFGIARFFEGSISIGNTPAIASKRNKIFLRTTYSILNRNDFFCFQKSIRISLSSN